MRSSGKTKKILTLCLCALLLAAAFSGCSNGAGSASDNSSSTTSSTDSTTSVTQQESTTYDTTVTYSSDVSESGSVYFSTSTDENAIVVTDGNITLDNITVKRESADSTGGDNSSFYGVGLRSLPRAVRQP